MSAIEPAPAGASSPSKRLTLSEITAALLEAQTRAHSSGGSVTLTRNARGNTQIEVVVRAGESERIATTADAELEAQAIYDRLRLAYPMLEEPAKP